MKLVERITDAQASIAAVDLGLDPTTPFGEFGMTIMLAMARMERRRLSDSWATAQQRAVERGASAGRTPYGYQRDEDGVLHPHPTESIHVQRAFELSAAHGASAANSYLVENAPGRYWTTDTTRRMLARRVYLGELRHGSFFNPNAHQALVSRAIWEAAQREPRAQVRSGTYPLSGIVQCGTCGAPMVAGPATSSGKRTYRCSAAQTLYKGPRCPKGATIVADTLEEHLRKEARTTVAGWELDVADGHDDLALAERAITEAELELDAFASDLTMRRALGETYHEKLALRVQAVESAQATYRDLAKDRQTAGLLTASVIDDPAMLGTLLRGMRLTIRVAPGRGSVSDRRSSFHLSVRGRPGNSRLPRSSIASPARPRICSSVRP